SWNEFRGGGSVGRLRTAAEDRPPRLREGFLAEVAELAGIEIDPVADRAGLVGDVRLAGDDHRDHRLGAYRTLDAPIGVVAAALVGAAGIDGFRTLDRLQVLVLEDVEPDAAATATAVDDDALVVDLLHRGGTLGTF